MGKDVVQKFKQTATLDDWSLIDLGETVLLTGEVSGHPRLDNGRIVSSVVLKLDTKNSVAETRNTNYSLGKPSQELVDSLNADKKMLSDLSFDSRGH
jgi:hypothetical protein